MEPIRQLLNRIRWDAEFGQGDFQAGIYDRVAGTVQRIPLERLRFEPGNHQTFTACIDGTDVSIPFHRIRAVWKNGACIWRRPDKT